VVEVGRIFSDNRGATMAIHGAGGSLGDIVGPIATGLLLSLMSWQNIISLYALLPVAMSLWSAWIYLHFGKNGSAERPEANGKESAAQIDLKTQFHISREILRKTHIWRVNIVAALRGMCFVTLVTFLPLFMKEDLGFDSKSIGLHFSLLWAMGMIASPIMGHLSDRLGRKQVLVPALFYSCLLIILLALFGRGTVFTVIIVLLGLSVRSDYSLVNATLLDIAGDQVASTMLGVLSIIRFVMGTASPVIAGAIYQYAGMQATLLFVAAMFFFSALIFTTVDLNKTA
jgi:MFS family permease